MAETTLLYCGDIVGRSGREAVLTHVPALRRDYGIDAVIASGDNAASGFGITPNLCRELLAAGVDVITGGDHIWDQREIPAYLAQEPRLLRPHNFPGGRTPGTGFGVYKLPNGRPFAVLHLLGQVFHKEYLDCPFACAERALAAYRGASEAAFILVDMHAEATSEKNAMGLHLDGRVSAVVGSHTHVPTNDARILPGGTAYQTDTGMCGDYAGSVIGFAPEVPMTRFLSKRRGERMKPASGEGTLCAVLIRVDSASGLARTIQPLQLGGALDPGARGEAGSSGSARYP